MYSSPTSMETIGDRYHEFVLTKFSLIEELQCKLRTLIHEPSGAQVMHIASDDPENFFCLSFQTLPSSSNGVAHILEHTVLCGSRKFPVKDPFFAMTRRSLNTFMNALTGADFTCYPAASQVEKDFYNLLEVYLDAVFHPELKELSFLQEGHRLEFADPENPKSNIEFKGIVYNEMKGSLSSADSRMWHDLLRYLVPDQPYAYNSGGDPKEILSLTYADLISFYETYYHPSRCLFFFYGNLPLKQHLDFIENHALKNVLKQPPIPPIPFQPRFIKPLYKEGFYPANEDDDVSKKSIVGFSWLTTTVQNQEEILALTLLDFILMNTDASLLKKSLLESKLCIQVDAYIDTEMTDIPYILVCKGCDRNQIEELQKLLFTSLKAICVNKIPSHLIETAIHQLEIQRTEISGDGVPFGLTLFMRSALAKQHGCNPENALMIHSLFEGLLQKAKDPAFLGELIQKHFIDNPHFVRLTMDPDPQLISKEQKIEREMLEKIRKNLTEKQTQKIVEDARTLSLYQKQTEKQALNCLPKVSLRDIPSYEHEFKLKKRLCRNTETFHHDCFTNHFIYANFMFDLPLIKQEDLPFVQLLISLIPELGVGKRDYAANLDYVQAHTGGIGASSSLYVQVENPNRTKPTLSFRGKALHRKADKLFSLLRETATSFRLDEKKRIGELILQIYNSMQNRLNRNALRYAIQLSLSSFTSPLQISNSWNGLNYYYMIKNLAQNLDQELPKLLEKFHQLKEQLFCFGNPQLILNCDHTTFEELYLKEFYGMCEISSKNYEKWTGDYLFQEVKSQAIPISSPVAFTAMAFKTSSLLHPHAPALACATHLFENKILHHRIREEGGAYGCGANFNPLSGYFYFHAYRDPHIAQTLHVFEEAIEIIASGNFDEKDLEEAKLGMIQNLDSPISPGSRAITTYTQLREGKTKELRQQYRKELLALNVQDVKQAVKKELLPQKNLGTIVSFADKYLIEKENVILSDQKRALPITLI